MTSSSSSTNQVLENHAGLWWILWLQRHSGHVAKKWKLNILVDHRPVHWHRQLHTLFTFSPTDPLNEWELIYNRRVVPWCTQRTRMRKGIYARDIAAIIVAVGLDISLSHGSGSCCPFPIDRNSLTLSLRSHFNNGGMEAYWLGSPLMLHHNTNMLR